MWDLAIKNGTCVTSTESFKADIYVKDGKIAAITTEDLGPSKETLDASGKRVYAGFIDTHVHSRDGGALHKETFAHSTRGAAMGGITTVVEMPNAVPPVCNVENFKAQKANLSSKAFVDFAMWALCLGDLNNKDLLELDKYGVAGYKFFWGYALKKSNYNLIYNYDPNDPDVFPPLDDGQVYGIFETVAKTGKLLGIHAENSSLIRRLTERIKPEEYATEYEALLACRPSVCEETVVQTAISFAKVTGCHLHILHTSAKETVDLVDAAQKKGLKVTAETCPHYLTLTKDDFKRVGPMIKGYPPVREKADQQRLWEGLRAGILSHVCSDHAPHTAQEKAGSLPNVEIFTSSQTTQVLGDGEKVTGIRVKDRVTDEERDYPLDGIFVQIGLAANSAPFRDALETTPIGEIKTDSFCRTALPGVYAAGDVSDVPYKQIVIAMGEGAKAALSAFDDRIRGIA